LFIVTQKTYGKWKVEQEGGERKGRRKKRKEKRGRRVSLSVNIKEY